MIEIQFEKKERPFFFSMTTNLGWRKSIKSTVELTDQLFVYNCWNVLTEKFNKCHVKVVFLSTHRSKGRTYVTPHPQIWRRSKQMNCKEFASKQVEDKINNAAW